MARTLAPPLPKAAASATDAARRPYLILPLILAATFMSSFDFNAVNVAAPTVRSSLHAGQASLELIVAGYAFTYAAGLVTGGRLGDLFGYRTLFLTGMGAFTVASALCGFAQSPGELVAARMLQGVAAAAMVPQVLALVTVLFPASERARPLSWFGVALGIGGVAGQVLGGLLIDADVAGLGWRVIFLLNLPVGAVALPLAARLLPRGNAGRRPRLDPVGVVGVAGSLALALVPLTLGRDEGWPLWTWLSLAASAPTAWATLRWEARLARTGGEPLVDPALLRDGVVRIGLAVNVAFMAMFSSSLFAVTLLLQAGLGLSPLRAGVEFLPLAALSMTASLLGRHLMGRFGNRTLVMGSSLVAFGLASFATALSLRGGHIGTLVPAVTLGVVGLGAGITLPGLTGAVLGGVRPQDAGRASGILSTAQQFAAATGVAVVGALFFAVLGTHAGTPGRDAYATATGAALWTDVGLTLIAVMLSARLVVRTRRG